MAKIVARVRAAEGSELVDQAATSIDQKAPAVWVVFDSLNACKVQPLVRKTPDGERVAMVETWVRKPTSDERAELHRDLEQRLGLKDLDGTWSEALLEDRADARLRIEDWLRRGRKR